MIAFARLHTIAEPLERDITTYAVIGHEMLAGRKLYTDLWDHKPPAIHLTYATAELVAGYGPQEVYLLNVLVAIVTTLGVWRASLACTESAGGSLLAAALWAVTSGDLALQANQPNTEAFLNACLIWALAILLGGTGASPGRRRASAAGALFALASLYKPVVITVPIALSFVLLARSSRSANGTRRALAGIAWMAAPGFLAWTLVFGWFAAANRFGDAFDAIVIYNRAYAGSLRDNLAVGLTARHAIPGCLGTVVEMPAMALLALVWSWLARRRLSARGTASPSTPAVGALLGAYALGVALAVALPGRSYCHYYQLWLPLLPVVAAWALVRLRLALPSSGRSTARALGVALLGVVVLLQVPSYLLSPDQWSMRKYGSLFVATRRAAAQIDKVLTPGETFYEWGAETGLYFYTRRDPPTGVFFNYPLLQGPLVRTLSARVIRDLAVARPELVIVATPDAASFSNPVMQWVAQRYVAVPPAVLPGIGYPFVLQGGVLQARLRARANSTSGSWY